MLSNPTGDGSQRARPCLSGARPSYTLVELLARSDYSRPQPRFDPSMSGGPVINEEGNVCTIICSSLPADESNPEHVSYASLIWPAFGTPIEVERPGQESAVTTLYDLAKEGRVEVDTSFDSVQIAMLSDGSRKVGIRCG
jgi:hypothetical protein